MKTFYRNADTNRFISAVEAAEKEHAEIFYVDHSTFLQAFETQDGTWHAQYMNESGLNDESAPDDIVREAFNKAGYYVWCCLPGCMPDSDAMGPYKSEKEAAQAYLE